MKRVACLNEVILWIEVHCRKQRASVTQPVMVPDLQPLETKVLLQRSVYRLLVLSRSPMGMPMSMLMAIAAAMAAMMLSVSMEIVACRCRLVVVLVVVVLLLPPIHHLVVPSRETMVLRVDRQ
jgi:hypothetical protein